MIADTMSRGSSTGRRSARTVLTARPPHPRRSGEDVEDTGHDLGLDANARVADLDADRRSP
jgi:hypothetical protein